MKKIKVIRRKLGRERAWGQAHCGFGEIEIDSRAKGRKELELIIHESMHVLFPDLDESEIEKKSAVLTRTLWGEHYRRVDNHISDPLQDE